MDFYKKNSKSKNLKGHGRVPLLNVKKIIITPNYNHFPTKSYISDIF